MYQFRYLVRLHPVIGHGHGGRHAPVGCFSRQFTGVCVVQKLISLPRIDGVLIVHIQDSEIAHPDLTSKIRSSLPGDQFEELS